MYWPRCQKVKGQGHTVTKTVTVARLLVTRSAAADAASNLPHLYLAPLFGVTLFEFLRYLWKLECLGYRVALFALRYI